MVLPSSSSSSSAASRRHDRRPHRPLTAVVAVIVIIGVRANTKNFCGSDWTAASTDCEARQPCAQGTDEECTSALGETCWADTLCDTALGHGALSNRNDPSHQRFCGTTWEDASTNCAVERHCPSGDESECDDGQECYSFLGSCNYIDMMVGNLDSASTVDEGSGNSTSTLPGLELDRDDPTRTNYCGVDWSDAIGNCDDDSHWCPDGTDEECPDGKICFAGTDCKYESDLVPTGAPIIPPSAAPTPEPLPTQSPVMYNAPENSRFCGTGWENVRTTCRLGSHCPSGDHAECPTGQQCLGWIQGCNIIDFEKHLRETGEEIFGSDHWLLPMDVDIPGLVDVNSTEADNLAGLLSPTDGLPPPDNILAALGVQAAAAAAATATLIPTGSFDDDAGVGAISADIPRYKDGNNHIFCGVSWLDASARCSPETFCLHGAAIHVCPNVTEYCFVGVTACDANEWIFPTASPTSASPTTSSPTLIITESNIIDSASPTQSVTSELSSTDDAAAEISFLIVGEEDGDVDDNDGGVNDEENINDDDQEEENTYNDVITSTPTANPSAISTETMSIEQIVDEDTVNEMEVATSTIVQSYCALSYVDIVTNCQELSTCNKNEQCLDGYTCFTNVECTVEVFEVPFEDLSPSPTSTPSVDMPFSQSEVFVYSSASPTSSMTTIKPTLSPVSMTPTTTTTSQESNTAIAPHFYCATSLDEISCSASPTCDDETMCPSGMFCFEVPTCYDNVSSSDDFWANTYSITTSPSTSLPSSFPTMLRSITISESPTYYLRSSSLRPTSSATNTAIVTSGRIQNYCAPSEDELLSLAPGTSNTPLCAVTNTCNDELQMCPPGTYCFVDYSCPLEISAEGGAVMTVVIPDSSAERSEVSIASNIEETPTNVTQQPWEIDWESETLGEATIDDTRVGDDLEAYWLLKENNSARSVASFSITVMLGLLLLLDII